MANSPFKKILFGKESGKNGIKNEDMVTLPELFGVKPWLYLAFLYGAAILLILFFVLIYPGIKNPGAAVVFASEPQGAAVRVDDVTLGHTPCEIFVARGTHSLEFILPGFTPDKQELDIKGRIFSPLFFPPRMRVSGTLPTPDPAGALALAALNYMQWAAAGEPTEAYQIPMVLSEGAYRTAFTAKDSRVRGAMQGILDNALRHTVTRASARDLVRAQFLLDSGGLAPSPLNMLSTLRRTAARVEHNPESAPWLESLLSEGAARKLTASRWYRQSAAERGSAENAASGRMGAPALPGNAGNTPSGSLSLEGMVFTAAPPLMIAAHLVPEEAWARFTAGNPRWGGENRENLVKSGLAGDDYLKTVENSLYPVPAAPGISWYAAEAYCVWLTARLPPSFAGWEVRLPSGEEWEYAHANHAELDTGLLWEWCADEFAPLAFFPVSQETLSFMEHIAASSASAQERFVRGGSWINPPGSVDNENRGSLPPSMSSPFVGFRPVIAPKEDNQRVRVR